MTRLSDAISLNRVSGLRRKATGMVSISVSSRSSRICLRICPLPNPSLNRLQGLFASLHRVLQNLLEFQLFLLRERLQHTSHHRNLNGDLSITDDRGERLSHRRSSNLPLLLRARRGGLKEMFQCMFATEERPQALLTENSGASHGQNSRSTGQPRAR